MKYNLFQIFYASAFLIHTNDGSKMLGIFPMAARSHFTCDNAIMKSLIDAGHEVTIITPFPKQASAHNYTSIIDISEGQQIFVGQSTFDEFITRNPFRFLDETAEMELSYCTQVLNLPEIRRILNGNEKFYDVLLVEVLLYHKCFFSIAEKMNVPIIGVVTTRTWSVADHVIQNSHHPAYIPYELVNQPWKLDHIFGRINNVFNKLVVLWYQYYIMPNIMIEFHEKHVSQFGPLGKYLNMEPDIIFFNNHASLQPRPMSPNAINIGGLHMENAKLLPENIQKFIDEANHGVILFSLGSVVRASTLPPNSRHAFRDAFAEIPQRVIWKFEEEMENVPNNVMVLDWLPQRDILEHKNVIAFISHCGLGGTNEAVYTATPVVAFPFFCDQPHNADLLEDLGVAVQLNIYDITKVNVLNALNEIINDTRYYNNMQKLSKQFKDRPMTPQQSIVYWTEYVIRHNGASHLRSPATRLSWLQFLLLDVVFIVSLIVASFLYFIIRILRIVSLCFTWARVRFSSGSHKLKNKVH